jgi:glycosyltransferase involved in cell wall biosynthesis
VKIAIDLFGESSESPTESRPDKRPGAVRVIFLSRIDRKKNLDFAIRLLSSLSGDVKFDIYGPIDDTTYWKDCEASIRRLPPSVHAVYRGPIPHHAVTSVLTQAHFFLLPTLGENFGHAIVEAFLAGCPTILSDRTPWRGLAQRGAGWDLALENPAAWREVLQRCIEMDAATYRRMSVSSHAFGQHIASGDAVLQNRRLFRSIFDASDGIRRDQGIVVA